MNRKTAAKRMAALALTALMAVTGARPAFAIDGYIAGTTSGWYFADFSLEEKTRPITEEECQKAMDNLLAMQAEFNEAGIYFTVFIAPSKTEVYGELLPAPYRTTEPSPVEKLVNYLHEHAPGLPVIYPKEQLNAAKNAGALGGVPLYYPNDSHWNMPGAYLGTQELIRALGEHFGHGDGRIEHTFSVTSHARYNNTWTDYYTYAERPQSKMTKRVVIPDMIGSIYAYYTSTYPECWPEKVYVAGDSFRLNMEPVLSERFRSLICMNRYYLDLENVAREDPDVFVLAMTEYGTRKDLEVISGFNGAALPLIGAQTEYGPDGWEKDGNGYWWRDADGTYPMNTWRWLDGDKDGVSECYYFDENGYCLLGATAPDGSQVNESGAWVVDGVVQTRRAAN